VCLRTHSRRRAVDRKALRACELRYAARCALRYVKSAACDHRLKESTSSMKEEELWMCVLPSMTLHPGLSRFHC